MTIATHRPTMAVFGLVAGLMLAAGPGQVRASAGEGPDRRYEDALELFAAGKNAAAIYILQQVSKDHPKETRIYQKLAEMAVADKNWAYAIQSLGQAAQANPEDMVSRRVLMSLFAAYQMPMEELLVGREVLDRFPEDVELIRRLAHLTHDQGLHDDEAQLRLRLTSFEPDDAENLVAIARIYADGNRAQEEIGILRRILTRFPDRREHRVRLAALYGESKDPFNQREVLLGLPDRNADPVTRKMFRESTRALRKERRLQDWVEPTVEVDRERSREFSLDRQVVEGTWMHPSLTRNRDRGVWGHYDHVTYAGTNVLAGAADIDTWEFRLLQDRWWDQGRSRLRLGVGATHVGVRSSFTSRSGIALSPADFPFLEAGDFGGTRPIGDLRYDRRLGRRLSAEGWLKHEVMSDLDAHIRMVTRSIVGGGLTAAWSDQTRLAVEGEVMAISDDNTHRTARFMAERILWGTGSEEDLEGDRIGFTANPPPSFVAVQYRFDFLDHAARSRLYQAYSDEAQHELTLIGERKITDRGFVRAEGLVARGSRVLFLKSTSTFMVGYRDPEEGNEVLLSYGKGKDTVTDGSQLNLTLLGDSRFEQFRLTGRWRF